MISAILYLTGGHFITGDYIMRFLVSDSNNRKKLVFVKLIILLIVSAVCFISNNSTVHAASGTLSEDELKSLIEEKLE